MSKQQIATLGEFSIDLWNDVPARDACWAILRDRATEIAAESHMFLTSDPDFGRSVLWMHFVDDHEGNSISVETTQDKAQAVMLRCCLWAQIPAAT
jgi:hypothetical protein